MERTTGTTAVCLALAVGCAGKPKTAPPKTIVAPIGPIEVRPRRPFVWDFELRDREEAERLSEEIWSAVRVTPIPNGAIVFSGDRLRIAGGEAYDLVHPILARMGIALKRRQVQVECKFVTMPSERFPQLGLPWRPIAHRGRARELVYWCTCDEKRVNDLLRWAQREPDIDFLSCPRVELLDGQHCQFNAAIRRAYVADYKFAAQGDDTVFTPVRDVLPLRCRWRMAVRIHDQNRIILNPMGAWNELEEADPRDLARPTIRAQGVLGLKTACPAGLVLPTRKGTALLPLQAPRVRQEKLFDVQLHLRDRQVALIARPELRRGAGSRQQDGMFVVLMKAALLEPQRTTTAPRSLP